MIAALLVLALQAAPPASTAPVAPVAPRAPAASAPAPLADASEPDLGAPTADGLESLQHAYHDGCEVRLYGEYDDMCSSLSDQIRHYRAALAKAQRKSRGR